MKMRRSGGALALAFALACVQPAAAQVSGSPGASNDPGVQGTGSAYNPPAGGRGPLGYLSGILHALLSPLTVKAVDSGGGDVSDPTIHGIRISLTGYDGTGTPCVFGTSAGCQLQVSAVFTGGLTGIYHSAPQTYVDGDVKQAAISSHGAWHVCLEAVDGNCSPSDAPVVVNPEATATGGCTPYHLAGDSTASTNATLMISGQHKLCSLTLEDPTGAICYVRMFNLGSTPTPSSSTPVHKWAIPALTSVGGIAMSLGPFGEDYSAGIGFDITGGSGENDTANAPVGCTLNASYK